MKINSIKTSTGYLHKGRGIERSLNYERECASERVNLKQNNNDQINTTIERNSDGRVSFKGGVPLLHRMANYTKSNPIVAEALFAILITCALRPATIMALPGKKNEDRENKINAAAHSVASGIIGFISATIVMSPFDAAMKKVKNDPAKYLGIGKKAESYLGDLKAKGLSKTAKFKNVETLMKMGPDIIIGIPRSIITIALIPPILKYVFGIEKKPKNKKVEEQQPKQDVKNEEMTKQFANASLSSSAFKAVKGGVQ